MIYVYEFKYKVYVHLAVCRKHLTLLTSPITIVSERVFQGRHETRRTLWFYLLPVRTFSESTYSVSKNGTQFRRYSNTKYIIGIGGSRGGGSRGSGPPFFSKIIGIDFYSGCRRNAQHRLS